MATNMAPHNLRDVFAAVELVMKKRRPKPTVEELMKVLPGPDFPSGGIIVDDGLADAYAHGKGSVRIRAKAEIVKLTRAREGIVVTELPYQVGPERVVSRVQELMRDEKLPQVTDIKNTSDRHTGLRLEIELRPGVNAQAVLTELFRTTPLEDSFSINNVVLIDGVPTTVGLWDLCEHYVRHRLDVVRRRSEFRLDKARRRLHLIEGLLIALDAIDLVVSIIRSSQDAAEAKERLMEELNLTEVQAVHILDMQLRRLTALAKIELEAEASELRGTIDDLEKLLKSEQRQRTVVLQELKDLTDAFGWDRRSQIIRPHELNDVTLAEAAEVEKSARVEEPCVVALSFSGMVGREPTDGPKKATFGKHDTLIQRVASTTHSAVTAVTSKGRCFRIEIDDVPEVTGRARGVPVQDLAALDKGESVLALVAPPNGSDSPPPILLVTALGNFKRISVEDLGTVASGKPGINLKPGDSVVAVFPAPDGVEIVAVASNAQVIRCAADSVAVQGKGAGGVGGMKLTDGARVVGAGVAEGSVILSVTDAQTAKVTDTEEIPLRGRNTSGVRLTKFRNEKALEWAWVGAEENAAVVVGQPDAPTRPDPSPEPLTIEHTGRDLVSKKTPKRLLGVGFGRW
jgi:DNA gyrase subunit A